MKIALSGDLHIRTGGKRAATCERVLFAMVDEWARRGVSLAGIPGDYYDTHPTEDDVLFARRLNEYVAPVAKLIVVAGNHDPKGAVRVLDAFRGGRGKQIVVVDDEPHVQSYPLAGGQDLRVACLPDLRGAYLARRRAEWGLPRGTPPIEVAREVLRELAGGMGGAGPRLFLGHLTLGDARMDNDQPARAPELTFTRDDLREVRAHAYALGHIHLRQAWEIDGRPCFYTGSPYGTDYGDLAPKSWTLLTWTGDRFEVEVVPTVAPRLVQVVGTWQRSGDHGEMVLDYAREHEAAVLVTASDLAGADVRLRYDDPLDDAAAAERAASTHRQAILAAGAVDCKIDKVPARTTRSRASQLGGARTDAEKLVAFWQATNSTPEPERRARVLGILARLQPHVPPEPPVSLIRVDGLRWQGFGRLKAAGGIGGERVGVHAVTGPNRAGKSTLLAAVSAALWCEGPKGTLDRLAHGKGAHVEVDVSTAGGRWTIKQDAQRKTSTVTESGVDLYAGGREGYYGWAESRIPTRAVLEQIAVLPPKRNGLLDLQDGALKDALLTLAGSSRFKVLADLARAEGTALKGALKAKREHVARMGDPASELAAAQEQTAAARAQGVVAAAEMREAEVVLALTEARDTARRERDASAQSLTDVANRITAVRRRIESAPDAAVVRQEAEAARAAHGAAGAVVQRLAVDGEGVRREVEDLREQSSRATARVAQDRARIERLAARLSRKAEYQAAAAELPGCRVALLAAEQAVDDVAAAMEQTDHRATLTRIRESAQSVLLDLDPEYMLGAVRSIHEMADAALTASPKLHRQQLQAAAAARNEAAAALAERERLAAGQDEVDLCEGETLAAEQAVEEEEEHLAVLAWRIDLLEHRQAENEAAERAAAEDVARAAAEVHRLTALVDQAADHGQAHGRLTELREQEAGARVALAVAEQVLVDAQAEADLAEVAWSWPHPPTRARQRDLAEQVRQAERQTARWEVTAQRAEVDVAALEEARRDLEQMERDVGDLAAFVRAVDKKGIQAFEADAIGTEVADHATDLLLAHGFRWIVAYDPLRESGKREVEQARWKLVEQDTGLEYDARSTNGGSSGGQEVVVATAVFLGAGMAVVRRGGGVKDATLAVDEMTSAVREPLVEPWLAMLRDGAARVGAKCVLLVPPNDARLVGACDGVVTVEPTEDGSVVR